MFLSLKHGLTPHADWRSTAMDDLTMERLREIADATGFDHIHKAGDRCLYCDAQAMARELIARREADRWTEEVPTEQAWYWHWFGNPEDSPFIYSVLKSGTNGECFIQGSHLTGAPWCKDVGGWWMKISVPTPPHD